MKGHKEEGCVKKFPEKAPSWYKEKVAKTKSASSNVEVSLTSLNSTNTRVDLKSLQGDTMAILRQENVWICDTIASTPVMWNNKGAINVHDTNMNSLGHVGSAMESTALINIPGTFLNKEGARGLQAILKDCSYNAGHNFNLLSMSKLLHKQGWKITHGDKSLIRVENGKGGGYRL